MKAKVISNFLSSNLSVNWVVSSSLEMMTFTFFCYRSLLTICIRATCRVCDLAFYVGYKCGICVLLARRVILLNITKLLELIFNVCVNMLCPECRRFRQNNCYTSNTGTIDNEQIAQDTTFVVPLWIHHSRIIWTTLPFWFVSDVSSSFCFVIFRQRARVNLKACANRRALCLSGA